MTPPTRTPAKLRAAILRRPNTRRISDTRYIVKGDPGLQDTRSQYIVDWDPETGYHHCSCYYRPAAPPSWRAKARAEGCSHVTAAQLHRNRDDLAAERVARLQPPARETEIPLPSDPMFTVNPGDPPIPDQFTAFRPHQWDAIERVMACYAEGASVVLLQAPTGTGKTLIAETVRRLIGGVGLYVCSTKTLQDQAARDFPYARVLKGRSNYPTLSGGVSVDRWGRTRTATPSPDSVTAADCTAVGGRQECRWCDQTFNCPYRKARARAQTSQLAILNTSYFLTDSTKGGRKFAGRDLAIFDEADALERELLGQAELRISQGRMKQLSMQPPAKKTADFVKNGVKTHDPARAWLPWVQEEALPTVRWKLRLLPPIDTPEATAASIKERNSLSQLEERLVELAVELPAGKWVYDGYDIGDVIFRPVQVGDWGRRMLWPHAKRFLLMSGTIISADQMAHDLGLDSAYRLVDVPMSFPPANRPINVVPVAEVTKDNQDKAWPKIARALTGVLALHPDDRVLVHTVSYPMAKFLATEVRKTRRPVATYERAYDRDGALAYYKATPGSVLVAPSMDRGIDLPGDLCRVVVIAKIPFGNLGDKRTAARLFGTGRDGETWYAVQAVRTLVQMTGRGVRSIDDHATAYILDHTFTTNIFRKHRHLLPGWWCEAVNWTYPVHRLMRAQSPA